MLSRSNTVLDFLGALPDGLAGLEAAPYLALIMVVSVLCQWLAWQVGLPSILLLLVVGFGLGQLVSPDQVLGRDLLFGGVTLAVGIILFEGSLSLRFRDVTDLGRPVLRLCTVTVLIAWALTTGAAWLIGFDLEVALLVGAVLVVTGPTVIAPILRTLRPTRRLSSLLRWEGIVVDPIGAVLAVLVFQAIVAVGGDEAWLNVLTALGTTILVGFGIGIGLAWVMGQLVARHAIPDFLHGVAFLAAAIGALVVSNGIQTESGLLTVTVMGVYLGNQRHLHLGHVSEFKEHLQVLLVGVLFLILAGRVSPDQIVDVAPRAIAFVLLLIVVVRPVSVLLGLWGTKATREERSLLAGMAPRGIVAAAVISIFGLELAHVAEVRRAEAAAADGEAAEELDRSAVELARLADQATDMVPLVFLVIVITVAVYGLGVGRLAERLGLATTSPQGVLFVGGQRWVVAAAKALEESRVPVLVVSREYAKLTNARMAGLRTETANILSDYAVKDMDLAGIKSLIASTADDEVNATAAREFAHVLGRANVFQLRRDGDPADPEQARRTIAPHLSARTAFQPGRTHTELDDLVDRGWTIKRTSLSSSWTMRDFRERYGDDAVLMFVLGDQGVTVATADTRVPAGDATVIALVPPEE